MLWTRVRSCVGVYVDEEIHKNFTLMVAATLYAIENVIVLLFFKDWYFLRS